MYFCYRGEEDMSEESSGGVLTWGYCPECDREFNVQYIEDGDYSEVVKKRCDVCHGSSPRRRSAYADEIPMIEERIE
jgi:hypothetical protein